MPATDIISRLFTLLSDNSSTVGTTAIQISGGPSTNWPLTSVAATYQPSYHRQMIRIVNNSAMATIFIGSASTITAGSGWNFDLAPGATREIYCNGSAPIWIIASALSTPFTLEEWQ